VKALSVQQPWAWAIVHGPKRIENRTWLTYHRGPLLIHAGKNRRRLGHYGVGEPEPAALAFGALIGTVEVVDCVRLAEVLGQPFAEGPFCWLLRNPQPFSSPIPYRGAQGLFDVPGHVLAAAAPASSDQPEAPRLL
jgi:hypothetical protein